MAAVQPSFIPNNSDNSNPSVAVLPRQKNQNKTLRKKSKFSSRAKVKQLPQTYRNKPIWLKFLLILNYSSSIFTFALIIGSLSLYSLVVYTPKLWTREYSKLKKLESQERELISKNEILKHNFAQEAEEKDSGLIHPNPSKHLPIWLEIPTNSPSKIESNPIEEDTVLEKVLEIKSPKTLGY